MGKAATRAKNKYNDSNYDRITLAIPKGMKEEIKVLADAEGKSVTQFIIDKIGIENRQK